MITAGFLALVIAVHDGDTIKIRTADDQVQAIRIAHIDAPELKQDWGRVSGASLRQLCMGTRAWIQPVSTDRYRRTVAEVKCRAKDVSHHQVERGMAWVFERYEPPSSALFQVQRRAQHFRRGLWRDGTGIPPWQFRHTPAKNNSRVISTIVDTE